MRDPFTMKCGQRESSLPMVKLAFARQKSIAQHAFGALESTPLHKTGLLRHQYVFDVFRMIDKKIMVRTGIEVGNVPVILSEPREE